jgi:hypothetical protein
VKVGRVLHSHYEIKPDKKPAGVIARNPDEYRDDEAISSFTIKKKSLDYYKLAGVGKG